MPFLFDMHTTDELFLQRCLDLAGKALGYTYPNPLVGSVIVCQGKIIGEGYHHRAGEAHAEINAIASVTDKRLLPQSTIYVSLEPCAHYGKTPPCAKKIIECGFRRVVIGSLDLHAVVNGQGIKMMEEAGIEVSVSQLPKPFYHLNRRFFTFHQQKRPYIILKWAESTDGFIDNNFHTARISNEIASQYVHHLRSREHAILTGSGTALQDNPGLTTRHIVGRNPLRLLLDSALQVPATSRLFDGAAETVILNSVRSEVKGNVTYVKTEPRDLSAVLHKLFELQIQSVLVEGGAKILNSFLAAGLWDEIHIIKNENLKFGNGTAAPQLNFVPDETKMLGDNTVNSFFNSDNPFIW